MEQLTRPEGKNKERRVLFLQGPLSPLFRLAGDKLRRLGARVYRINFCAGDWLHWHDADCVSYKGTPENWDDFIEKFLNEQMITDLVLHGDQRLYHRVAISHALKNGVYVAVTELGALRSGWMTLERNGLSTLSHFPTDPDAIREVAKAVGEVDMSPAYPASFWLQTAPDVTYNLTNQVFKLIYPNYIRHTIYPPIIEYLRGALRLLGEKHRKRKACADIENVQRSGKPYFVLPLQLEGDFQLRRHSPYESFSEVLELVFKSFAEHSEQETLLVIKSHPLDVGFENWSRTIQNLAQKYRLDKKIIFLDGGGLKQPFEKTKGVVTLNSTAGLEALQQGLPVKTLVPAHFDIVGLTHQGDLASFWKRPIEPNLELFESYIMALVGTTQFRGSIHNKSGTLVAADNLAQRIFDRKINLRGAYVSPPPRLERARKLGVPL